METKQKNLIELNALFLKTTSSGSLGVGVGRENNDAVYSDDNY